METPLSHNYTICLSFQSTVSLFHIHNIDLTITNHLESLPIDISIAQAFLNWIPCHAFFTNLQSSHLLSHSFNAKLLNFDGF